MNINFILLFYSIFIYKILFLKYICEVIFEDNFNDFFIIFEKNF